MEQFKVLLVGTYSRALLEYSGQEVKFYPAEQNSKPNLAVVKTELTNGNSKPFPVDCRMYQKNQEWKVVDPIPR